MANNNNKPRKKFLTVGKFIFIIIFLCIVAEWCYVHFDLKNIFTTIRSWLKNLSPILVAQPFLQKVIEEKVLKKTSNSRTPVISSPQEATDHLNSVFQKIIDNMLEFLENSIHLFINSKFFCAVMIFYIMIGVPVLCAENHGVGLIINTVLEMQYSPTDESETEELSLTSEEASNDEVNPVLNTPPSNTITPSANISNEISTTAFLIDPERYFTLPESDYNKLYFLSGAYQILDWSDVNRTVETLNLFFMDLRSEQMTNTFDSKAPATLCKEIADVSELEKNLTNSEELEKIIDTRLDAWSQYQKYSLSKLLAANYQCYALEYQKINGNFSTIEYYYGNSIFWLFECLKFSDISDDRVKTILASLKMRYHDIAVIALEDSTTQRRAYILSEAFEILANNYSKYND